MGIWTPSFLWYLNFKNVSLKFFQLLFPDSGIRIIATFFKLKKKKSLQQPASVFAGHRPLTGKDYFLRGIGIAYKYYDS